MDLMKDKHYRLILLTLRQFCDIASLYFSLLRMSFKIAIEMYFEKINFDLLN